MMMWCSCACNFCVCGGGGVVGERAVYSGLMEKTGACAKLRLKLWQFTPEKCEATSRPYYRVRVLTTPADCK